MFALLFSWEESDFFLYCRCSCQNIQKFPNQQNISVETFVLLLFLLSLWQCHVKYAKLINVESISLRSKCLILVALVTSLSFKCSNINKKKFICHFDSTNTVYSATEYNSKTIWIDCAKSRKGYVVYDFLISQYKL